MNSCLRDLHLTYDIKYKTIIVRENSVQNENVPRGPFSSISPPLTIKGIIKDELGNPLEGVTVTVKETGKTTISDYNGNYSIVLNSNESTLVFTFIGLVTQEIKVGNSAVIDVRMKADMKDMNQVVVIGYGSLKKGDLTGSVASVKAVDVVKSTDMSLNAALQGRAAGVQVTSTEGAPGAAVSINIRSGSSISASNDPLYVIDGFPMQGGSNLNINGNDVQSVEILKDASATAIYGSRGANGVVIITTKSGRAGKFNLSYDAYYGIQILGVRRDLINSQQYAMMQHYLIGNPRNSGIGDTLYGNWQSFKDSVSTNWQDKVFRKAPMQSHNISFTGGTKALKLAGSLNYTGQNGIAIGTSYDRYTARLNTTADISSHITNQTIIGLSYSNRKGSSLSGSGGITYSILKGSPYKPSIVPDLNRLLDAIGGPGGSNGMDPYIELTDPRISDQSTTASVNTSFSFKLLENLVLRIAGGIDYSANNTDEFYPKETSGGYILNGYAAHSTYFESSLLNENTLNYEKSFGDHQFSALAGFTMQTTKTGSNGLSVSDFPIQSLGYDNLSFGSRLYTPSSGRQGSGILSYLGRVNYTFKDKYLVTASLRADGSSKFVKQKWGYFPSVAIAWKINEENFMKQNSPFSTFKLRASTGMTGNESISPYSTYSTYQAANTGGFPTIIGEQTVVGLVPSQLGNRDLRWETTIQSNIGLDMGFLNDRILITADIYKKKSKDLLLQSNLSTYSGFSTTADNNPGSAFVFRNIGDIQVKGFEFNLNTVNLTGKLKWNTNFNIAFNKSKVLALNENQTFFTLGSAGRLNNPYIITVGQPLGNFYGYVYDGIFHTQEEYVSAPIHQSLDTKVGTRRYKDINGDGFVNEDDRTVIGNGNPKFFGGFTNDFSFGKLEFSFLFTFSYGNKLLNAEKAIIEEQASRQGGLADLLLHWTPDNPGINMKRWTNADVYNPEYDYNSSYLVEDGSYLRLKNVMAAYSFSRTSTSALVKNVRVYLSAQNLLTFTHYTGYDPEVNYFNSIITPGADLGGYPRSRIFTLGVRAEF